jgi:predicted amidohydrolase YtcJ
VVAHTQLVHPDDRARFAVLGVIANFEPLWARLDPMNVSLISPRLGPLRSAMQYPIATLASLGAPISFGSDWPVSSVSPLEGLSVAVTRQMPDGTPRTGWMPEERLTILDAIRAYTAGAAYQAFDDRGGSIDLGRRADFCLVETDITAMSGLEVADVSVLGTWIGGAEVWRA